MLFTQKISKLAFFLKILWRLTFVSESRLSLDKSINLLCTENATKRQKIVIFIYKTEELTKTRRCILHNEPCDWMGLTGNNENHYFYL